MTPKLRTANTLFHGDNLLILREGPSRTGVCYA